MTIRPSSSGKNIGRPRRVSFYSLHIHECTLSDLAVLGSRRSVYVSCRTSRLCVRNGISTVRLSGASEKNTVPSPTVLPKTVLLNEGVPADFHNARGTPCLVTPDDLLNDVYSKQVCDLFSKGSIHRNICLILNTQNLFHKGRFLGIFP